MTCLCGGEQPRLGGDGKTSDTVWHYIWESADLEGATDETATVGTLRRPQGVFSAVHLFYALHEALTMILERGCRSVLRGMCSICGVPRWHHCLRAPDHRQSEVASPTVTCVCLPVVFTEFLHHFRQDHGPPTLPGIGDYRPTVVRWAHGVTATPRNIPPCLHA